MRRLQILTAESVEATSFPVAAPAVAHRETLPVAAAPGRDQHRIAERSSPASACRPTAIAGPSSAPAKRETPAFGPWRTARASAEAGMLARGPRPCVGIQTSVSRSKDPLYSMLMSPPFPERDGAITDRHEQQEEKPPQTPIRMCWLLRQRPAPLYQASGYFLAPVAPIVIALMAPFFLKSLSNDSSESSFVDS